MLFAAYLILGTQAMGKWKNRISDLDTKHIINQYQSGVAPLDIANKLNIGRHLIYKILKNNGVKILKNRWNSNYVVYNKSDIDDEIIKLHTQKKTKREICTELNVSWELINKKHKDLNLKPNDVKWELPTNLKSMIGDAAFNKLTNKEWLINEYVAKNRSTRSIASELGCGKKSVSTALKRFGIKPGSTATKIDRVKISEREFCRQAPQAAHNKINNKKWLIDNYITQNKSAPEIAEELGLSKRTVISWIRKFGIKKERKLQLISCYRRYEQINGYAIDSEEAIRMRLSHIKGETLITNKAGTIRCHSSWESQVAKYLDACSAVAKFGKESIIIPYTHNNKNRMYYVDFLVEFMDGSRLLIEVKGTRFLKVPIIIAKLAALTEYSNKLNVPALILTGKSKLDIQPLINYIINLS